MYPTLRIGALMLPVYGLCMLLAHALGALLTVRYAKKAGLRAQDALFGFLFIAIGGLVCGKLFALASGASLRGNKMPGYILGVLAGGALYCKKTGASGGGLILAFVPYAPLMLAVVRVGCFCAGCCHGVPCEGFLRVIYPPGGLAPAGVGLFPSQLAEAVCCLMIWGALMRLRARRKEPLLLMGATGLLYGAARLLLAFTRADASPLYQALWFALAAAGGAMMIYNNRRHSKKQYVEGFLHEQEK